MNVAFLIFNRPDLTKRVFDCIREARPTKLFVIADGPRPDRVCESELVAKARAVTDNIDWPCEVFRNYSDVNLGCGKRVSSGISWVFEHVEQTIILEDDCLPHPSFFLYCTTLLHHYRADPRVGCISGNNFQAGRHRGDASYYFSKYPHCWGWATWARAWRNYDFHITQWETPIGEKTLRNACRSRDEQQFWRACFDQVKNGAVDTWDYQWVFSCWQQSAMTALPNVNLVSNIGFDPRGTHTLDPKSPLAYLPIIDFGHITHPLAITLNPVADRFTFESVFKVSSLKPHQRLRMLIGAFRQRLVQLLVATRFR